MPQETLQEDLCSELYSVIALLLDEIASQRNYSPLTIAAASERSSESRDLSLFVSSNKSSLLS